MNIPRRGERVSEISNRSYPLIVYDNRQQFLDLNAISKTEDWKGIRRFEKTCAGMKKYKKWDQGI